MNDNPWYRIPLAESRKEFIQKIAIDFNLGAIKSYKAIMKGLIELNIKVHASTGIYVIKVFSNKRLPRVKDLLRAQKLFDQTGIPVTKILHTSKGKEYFKIHSVDGKPYYGCVLKWFSGQDFSHREPTNSDLVKIAGILGKINKVSINIKPIYDEWFPSNFLREYKQNKILLDSDYIPIVNKIGQEFEKIQFNKFKLGLVHGDLSREHVMKDEKGDYCILDFGGVNINYPIVDLAFAMSYYCLELNSLLSPQFLIPRYSILLDTYRSIFPLSTYEIECLPTLIRSNYALCYIAGKYYWNTNKDLNSIKLIDFGVSGMKISFSKLFEQKSY